MSKKDERSNQQALNQLESIRGMIKDLRDAEEVEDYTAIEKAQERILESPLSVQVRSGWVNCKEDMEPEEFNILLCTGGPAVRITGEINDSGEPDNPVLEHQDWFEPWKEVNTYWALGDAAEAAEEDLAAYCQQFYFGE